MLLAVSIMLAASCVSRALAGGKLSAFASDVTAQEDRGRGRQDSDDSWDSEFWGEILSDVFEFTLVNGGVCSLARVTDPDRSAIEVSRRERGEPLLPFARMDVAYQAVESDIDAMDVRTELGYGPVGAHFDFTRYWERSASDEMNLIRALGAYRMSFGSHVEIDLGCGVLTQNGEQTDSMFLFSLPVLVHPSKLWGIECRPAWADRVSDYDVALLLTRRCASLKLGYRWVDSPHESLDGPYAGISIRL